MSLPRLLAVGPRPRAARWGLVVALVATAVPTSLRLLAPEALLAAPLPLPIVLAAAGAAVAAGIGRRRGGVLAAVACVWLPVTAAEVAGTAIRDPFTPALVARTLPAGAWVALPTSAFVGTLAFAVGGWPRVADGWRTHRSLAVAPRGVRLAAAGVGVAVAAAVGWALATGRPTAVAPVPVGVGWLTAALLGVRRPGTVVPALVGWACVATALASFVAGFGPHDGVTLRSLVVVAVGGGVGGVPIGAAGYATGRVLAADLDR